MKPNPRDYSQLRHPRSKKLVMAAWNARDIGSGGSVDRVLCRLEDDMYAVGDWLPSGRFKWMKTRFLFWYIHVRPLPLKEMTMVHRWEIHMRAPEWTRPPERKNRYKKLFK